MKIDIKGAIISNNDKWIYDLFDMEATCPNDVNEKLMIAGSKDLEVVVNSNGGDVFSGSEIYTSLMDHKGSVTVKIVGVAASAASVIAMSGDKTLISPTAQLMIHNASMLSAGDHKDLKHDSDFLKGWDKSIANAYMLKSGISQEELLKLMNKETWLGAKEAKEKNLVDEIMFDNSHQLVASASDAQMLPPEVISKIRNEASEQGKSSPKNTKSKDDGIMDLEKIKNEHPDLYEKIKNEGYEKGVQAENDRFKAIDDMAVPGHEDLINKAKYETKESAEKLAMNIIKSQKEQGYNFLENRSKDAKDLDGVQGDDAPEGDSVDKNHSKNANLIAGFINKQRGGSQ